MQNRSETRGGGASRLKRGNFPVKKGIKCWKLHKFVRKRFFSKNFSHKKRPPPPPLKSFSSCVPCRCRVKLLLNNLTAVFFRVCFNLCNKQLLHLPVWWQSSVPGTFNRQSCYICLSLCLSLFVCPIITHESLDWFASKFDLETR